MTSTFIFDCETTGLPLNNKWPFPVQIAWIILDTDGETIEKSFIIKPNNFIIPEESIKIHKITNEIAERDGVDIKGVLLEFKKDYNESGTIVAHNLPFDMGVIKSSFVRNNIDISFLENEKNKICTMKSSTKICKLPFSSKSSGYKWPKLNELYEFLFNKNPDANLHNALEDSRITLQCYKKLQEMRKDLMLN